MGKKDIVKYIINEYGVTSPNAITDAILPGLKEWKNRPLQKCYPFLFVDCMYLLDKIMK